MNTQVAVVDEFENSIQSISKMQTMCSTLMKTKHYQKMGEEGIFAIVTKAKSIGLDPLEALNGGLYFVQGKVGMSSETMASLIRGAGHSIIKDPKSNNDICILHGKRKDNGDTWTITFSLDDARRAGLMKNMYEKYPAIMLYNRSMSMLARQLFPDVIKGAGYTLDELKEIERSNKIEQHPSVNLQTGEVQEVIAEVEEVKRPSAEEIENLEKILLECSHDYQESVEKSLRSMKISSLKDVNSTVYVRLHTAALKKREEHKLSQQEESNESVAVA